jgi:hypothetical protein
MPTEDNKAAVYREFEEMLNQGGNLDAAEEIFAPNYVGHAPLLRRHTRHRRRQAVSRHLPPSLPRSSDHHRGYGGRRG